MPDDTARLKAANRAALAALCLVLAGSVGLRVFLHGRAPAGVELPADEGPFDLGEGVLLPRAEATSQAVWAGPCDAPVAVDFVPATAPDGDAPSSEDGRTFYAYRGQVLDGRLAPLALKAMHFSNRALGLLHVAGRTAADELAVKFTAPAGCTVAADEAMAALRREALGLR